jgi:hypothetical protein
VLGFKPGIPFFLPITIAVYTQLPQVDPFCCDSSLPSASCQFYGKVVAPVRTNQAGRGTPAAYRAVQACPAGKWVQLLMVVRLISHPAIQASGLTGKVLGRALPLRISPDAAPDYLAI